MFIARQPNLISDPKAKADVSNSERASIEVPRARMAERIVAQTRPRRYLLPISPLSNTFLPLRPISVPIWSDEKGRGDALCRVAAMAPEGRPEDAEKVWNV